MVRFLRPRWETVVPATVILLAVAACALLLPQWSLASSEPVAAQKGTVLVSLPWGAGEGQVGIASTKEGLTRGPEALAVSPDGRIAVLDSVNHRVVLLDQQGRPIGKLDVPLAQPRFLAVDDDALYVLDVDADHKLAMYTWAGERTGLVSLPPLGDVVTGLFATSEGACVEVAHRTTLLLGHPEELVLAANARTIAPQALRKVDGRPLNRDFRQAARTTYKPKDGVKIHALKIDGANLQTTAVDEWQPSLASGRAIEHLVSVDGDGRDGLLVGARLMQPEVRDGEKRSLAITRLSDASREAGTVGGGAKATQPEAADVLLLAECDFAYLGQPYVVAPDGRVFQPVADTAGYTILVHSFAAEVQP